MFINISNHPSSKWKSRQTQEAQKYGEIVDIPFPALNPRCTDQEINSLVEDYVNKVMEYDAPVAMVQGEFIFTYRLVSRLKEAGAKTVASQSERRTIEYIDDNGNTVRQSEFEFVRFMEY